MICAYCEKPLTCDACQAPYRPGSASEYEKLSEREEAVFCPHCEEMLVCHWCKTPYDGRAEEDTDAPSSGEAAS